MNVVIFDLTLQLFPEQVDYLYLAKSACWKLDKKRIFNYRRIIFNPVYLPEQYKNIGPSELIESILSAASHLSMQGQEKSSNQMYVCAKPVHSKYLFTYVEISVKFDCIYKM